MFRGMLESFLKPIGCPFSSASQWKSFHKNQTVVDWIAALPEDKQKRVRLIRNEITLRMAEEKKMPQLELLTKADYEEMLEMSNNRRQQYYKYLHASTVADTNDDMKKLIRKQIDDTKKQLSIEESPNSKHIQYGLHRNTQFLKIERKTINKWMNLKLIRAIKLNEQPLIFDCGFGDTMTKRETIDLARQISQSFAHNRLTGRPFVLHLCNMSPNSTVWNALSNNMQGFDKLPWHISTKDIIDVVPAEKLVYLSPDAPDVLEHFNADDCYVLGGIVDKGNRQPLTLAKSKRLGIRTARIPLEKFIKFNSHKTLTLDRVTKIMIEFRRTNDWSIALKHVPSRMIG